MSTVPKVCLSWQSDMREREREGERERGREGEKEKGGGRKRESVFVYDW